MNPHDDLLLSALKQAMQEGGEHRLHRAGKQPGLFAGKSGPAAEAASRAMADGLLDLIRSETKGKTTTEWVKITPKGIDYLAQHESPTAALDDLRELLHVNQDGLPAWVADLRHSLGALSQRFLAEVETMRGRLDTLSERVAKVLERLDKQGPPLPDSLAQSIPWAGDLVSFLDHRRQVNGTSPCPLAELFSVAQRQQEDLTLKDFHAGLRRLHEAGTIRLKAGDSAEDPAQPEFALLDGGALYYYAER